MFRKLLDDVRVSGYIDLSDEIFLKDVMPILYKGDCPPEKGVHYYNSGGRSILIERGSEKLKVGGVDPFGELTKKVAESGKNKINDINYVFSRMKGQKEENMLFDGKPFGVFTRKNAENAKKAFERLGDVYRIYGFENPCEFMCFKETGVEKLDEMTYQIAYKLPSLGADFRVKEFDSLLIERLDACSPDEVINKCTNLNRLYGRFIYWAGYAAGLLSVSGIKPTDNSFRPQNWVIGKAGDGYGLYRVDHTSSAIANPEESLKRLLKEDDHLPHIVHEFSVFAERVQIASNRDAFLPKEKRNLKFSEILLGADYSADISRVIKAHKNVFLFGLRSALERIKPEPIPERMFSEALE